ncbi:MAG: DUF4143 domain-containing protein [candidate division KSB1 bacterium]|nr:DUF4143 domain-containing protein [candidate division KSB1 bacterium]MDZ7364629.1 DUF4143 domain-containing protein [candidate division KSB1 bacterium]MDZ7402623.1 DUF4143 domain-containing protein [candidate division KSB1 bacterium]
MWEHFVLNELYANLQTHTIHYCRDKRGHEVDFVLTQRGRAPALIECKWSVDDEFDPANLQAFRRQYPKSAFFVVANHLDRPFTRRYGDISVKFVNLSVLIENVLS